MRTDRHSLRCLVLAGVLLLAASGGLAASAPTPASAPCRAGSARQRVTLAAHALPSQAVVSLVVSLVYDPTLVRLPELGSTPAVRKRLTARSMGAMLTPNDLGGTLRIVAAQGAGLTLGPLVDVEFDRCEGARAVAAGDLRCTVDSCAGSGGAIEGCTCTVTVP